MLKILQDLVQDKKRQGVPNFVIKNFLKEYLQYPVLEFIYNNENYRNFIFTGGSCLRICFNAPRLSEDLDFDLKARDYQKLNLKQLVGDLKDYFKKKFLLDIIIRSQSDKRVYLKFPVLRELNLAAPSESDLLYVKIELGQVIIKRPRIELTPISNFGFNFVAKNYSLEFLMTGKLNAIFTREWFKGKENEVNVKGRDFYDLFWYLKNNIEPDYQNLKDLINIADATELKKKLKDKMEKSLTSQKLSYDLKNFFPDQNFVNYFCKNYKRIIGQYLQ